MRTIGRILRFLFRSIVTVFAALGLLIVVLVLALIYGGSDLQRRTASVPDRLVLTVELARGVVDQSSLPTFAAFSGRDPYLLRTLVDGIERAAGDPRVLALVVKLGGAQLSLAHAQEISEAVAVFRRSGKRSVAFAESFGDFGDATPEYLLASALQEIWMQPSGHLALNGLLLEAPFLKEGFDKLDVEAQFLQRHEYKAFPETFMRDGWSEPARRSLSRVLDDWVTQFVTAVAADRALSADEARPVLLGGPYLADEALARRLVDRLDYLPALDADLAERLGPDAPQVDLSRYAAAREAEIEPEATVALVYGVGPVVSSTRGESALFGQEAFRAEEVAAAIEAAADDADIAAIILRIDSPGGSYVASDTVWHAVVRARGKGKPVVASFGATAASGGYFVAMAADGIVALPGTLTGSIGTFGGKFVLEGLWENLGVEWDRIAAGERAAMWSPNRRFTEDEWARLAELLDAVYEDFTAKLGRGRGLSASAVDAVARGRVWTGGAAEEIGLVDRLGGLSTALALVREKVGLNREDEVQLVLYPRPKGALDRLQSALERGVPLPGAMAAALGLLPDPALHAAVDALEAWVGPLDALRPPAGVLQMPPLRTGR